MDHGVSAFENTADPLLADEKPHGKKYWLYVGTGPGVIHTFSMDADTGHRIETGDPVAKDGAGNFLATSPNGRFLYAASWVDSFGGGAAAFAIDPSSGLLRHINTVSSEARDGSSVAAGATTIEVATKESYSIAVLAAYHDGGVKIAKICEDGSLTNARSASSSVWHPTGSHPHCAFADRSGVRVLVADLGQDKIYVYDVDPLAGSLTEKQVLCTDANCGPRHLCFHPEFDVVYCINEKNNTITVYSYNHLEGVIGENKQTVSTLPVDCKVPSCTADIHITPDGRFVYGSNRGHNSLVCFAVGPGGMLEADRVKFTDSRGKHPRNFSILPCGQWVVVANELSDNVAIFKLEKSDGSLTWDEKIIPNIVQPRCIKWVEVAVATTSCSA